MKKVRIAKNKIVKTTREIHFSPDNQFEKNARHMSKMIAITNGATILSLQNGFNTIHYTIFKNNSKINTRIQNSA